MAYFKYSGISSSSGSSGALVYKGTWNASTNTPTLSNGGGGGDPGDYYVVSVAGTTSIDGISDWQIGDWIVNNGSAWEKIDNTDQVTSVFGRQGDVVATTNDYTWVQIDKTVSDIADITTKSHTSLSDIGTNTHAQIDSHIASASNPHSTSVSNLSDVTLTALADGELLASSGGNWINQTLEELSIVSGPATATDNAVPKFDGATGKLIQESGIIIDDSDNITGINNLTVDGYITEPLSIGDPGLEAGGVNINGVTYDAAVKINDIGGTEPAQQVIHRHSTTLQSALIGSRSNSDTSAHGAVTNGMNLFEIFGVGWTATHYDFFGSIRFLADSSGTISATSSPGTIDFRVTPDGSNAPVSRLTIRENGNVEIQNATASTVPYLDANKAITSSAITPTELGFLTGLTSSVQNHITDSTIHFTEASIDHTAIQNIGTNTHAQIDSHIAASSGIHGITGSVLGTTDPQVVTSKDIDGGTASNSSRITIPKNTTTNLNGLTRKEGTVVYDTTTSQLKFDNGTVLTALSSPTIATPDVAGVVTSFAPTVKSRVHTVSSANYTVLDTDGYDTILVTTGASDRTITYPTASDNDGRELTIIKVDSGSGGIISDGEGAETIGGKSTITIYGQFAKLKAICNGITWFVVDLSMPWQTYTPSFSHTSVSSVNVKFRVINGTLEAQGYYTLSTRSSTEIQIGTPHSWTLDVPGSDTVVIGDFVQDANTADNNWVLGTNGDTFINVGRVVTGGSTSGTSAITDGAINLSRHTFHFTAPILELSVS